MEKINSHLGEFLKPVKLHYDDIEEIIDVLKEGSGEVKIEADDYKINSLEEILSINKQFFTNLEITQEQPMVSVQFQKNQVWIYASEDTPVQRGLYYKLKSIIQNKKRPFSTLIQSTIGSGALTGASTWFFFSTAFEGKNKLLYLLIGLALICIGVAWMTIGYRSKMMRFSLIIPTRKKESPSFWTRNKDQLFIAMFSAALGVIGTLILTKLF